MIQTYPAVYLPLENLSVDKYDISFAVLSDATRLPYNYMSGFTSAHLTIYNEADESVLFELNSTGATNIVDVSNSVNGVVRIYSPSLTAPKGEYQYLFYVQNSTERLTITKGTFTII